MKLKLAENIRTHRRARSLTQEQLAEALGVTIGAVSKWESGMTTPDLSLIVELAALFETSVDVLLGYELRVSTLEQTVERIRALRHEKKAAESAALAERALLKFPNSFQIAYHGAMSYYVILTPEACSRAVELFERACALIDQNTDPDVGMVSLQNRIAECYATLGRYDDAIALLKKNNFDGMNNALIGALLAKNCRRHKEALPYLSAALGDCQQALLRTCLGYINAYTELGRLNEALELLLWFIRTLRGLYDTDKISYMTKSEAMLLTACAELCALQGNLSAAGDYLRQAIDTAKRFDAAPYYGMKHLKFYHGPEDAKSFDDFGATAMDGIANMIRSDESGQLLLPLWSELTAE